MNTPEFWQGLKHNIQGFEHIVGLEHLQQQQWWWRQQPKENCSVQTADSQLKALRCYATKRVQHIID
jgi:hypothetical protein